MPMGRKGTLRFSQALEAIEKKRNSWKEIEKRSL
jgi:hypothetical protein